MKFYCETIENVLKSTQSSAEGLTTAEAERRLAENGKNKLKEGKKDSLLVRFLKQLADPMIIILLVAAVVSGVLEVAAHGLSFDAFTDSIIISFVSSGRPKIRWTTARMFLAFRSAMA